MVVVLVAIVLQSLRLRLRFSRAVASKDGFFAGELLDVGKRLRHQEGASVGLKTPMLVLLGIGAVVGTGIFTIAGSTAQQAGPGMVLSFLLAGAIHIAIAACYAELTVRVAGAGGAFSFVRSAFGQGAGSAAGWLLLATFVVQAAVVAAGWSGYLTAALTGAGFEIPEAIMRDPGQGGFFNLPAMLLCLAITGLLCAGTSPALKVNAALVVLKLAVLLPVILLGFGHVEVSDFTPLLPRGLNDDGMNAGMIGAALSVFWAFAGYEVIANAADESQDPERGPARAILLTAAICAVIYIVVITAIISVLNAQPISGTFGFAIPGSIEMVTSCDGVNSTRLACSFSPVEDALRGLGASELGYAARLVAWATLPTLVIAALFALSRTVSTMAQFGALPEAFASDGANDAARQSAVIVAGAIVTLLAGFAPAGMIASTSNLMTLASTVAIAITLLALRRQSDDNQNRSWPAGGICAVMAIAAACYLATTTSFLDS